MGDYSMGTKYIVGSVDGATVSISDGRVIVDVHRNMTYDGGFNETQIRGLRALLGAAIEQIDADRDREELKR